MYVSSNRRARRALYWLVLVAGLFPVIQSSALGQGIIKDKGIVQRISGNSDRLEMTVNTSQIITLGSRIPRIQVNNPELLSVTALSATEIQVAAKRVGVTTINLWDENGEIYSVDVTILGDARELELALRTQFPNSTIKVYRYSNALVLKGFVDRPDYVSQIMRLAEDYAPKVVNNISVGGVQQIMLKVKVMEVSRTKLREFGFDFDYLFSGGFVTSAVGGIAGTVSETFRIGISEGGDDFLGFFSALEQHDLAKILAEPVLTTVSGRPAKFHVGGEIGFPVSQNPTTNVITVEFKEFGTVVDFLPIVLGNGNIRLEVRPTLSEIDPTLGVGEIPGFRKRQIDTGVEMKAGQTLALAGLIQQRTEAQMRGLPIIAEVPYVGVPFRTVREKVNEIELLILVTPEFVDAMDPHEVPPCGPGMFTTSPSSHELYCNGYLEVPACGLSGCDPSSLTPGNLVGPGTVVPGTEAGPAFEPVPGLNGTEGYLPEATPGPPGVIHEPPTAPTAEPMSINRMPEIPTGMPAADVSNYHQLRSPSYDRDQSYGVSDLPPGPIGPIGYDVQE